MKSQERMMAAAEHEVDPRDWDRTHDGAPEEMRVPDGKPVELGEEHRAVIELLSRPRRGWVPLYDIARAMERVRRRYVAEIEASRAIDDLVDGGMPVVETNRGWRIARTEAELAKGIELFRSRLAGGWQRADRLRRLISSLESTRARLYPSEPTNG